MPQPASRRRLLRSLAITAAIVMALLVVIPLSFSAWANERIRQQEIHDPTEDAPGQFVTVNDYRLHYQAWGDPIADPTGAPILLIHGFASSGLEFGRIVSTLSLTRSVLAIDLLGYGFSQRLAEPSADFSQRGQVALVRGVLDKLGLAQVDVVGASYGGAIAGQLALDDPARVRRLVFIDAQIYEVGSTGGEGVANLPFGLNRALTWSTLGGGPLSATLLQAACYNVAACLGNGDFTTERNKITQIRGNVDSLVAFSRSPRDQRLPAEVTKIIQPALILWGRNDAIIPPANAERLAHDLPNAQLHWIEQAGHVPHIEKPDEVASAIVAFLSQSSP